MLENPAIAQAISIIAGAIAMAIVSIVSYYFPKDHDRFDKKDDVKEKGDTDG